MAKLRLNLSLLGLSFLFSQNILAAPADYVCLWQNKADLKLATQGYTFGNGSVSTFEECGIALRAMMMFIDFGQGDGTGTITFTEPSGKSNTCSVQPAKLPFDPQPPAFSDVMWLVYKGRASVVEVSEFKTYLDENLAIDCSH